MAVLDQGQRANDRLQHGSKCRHQDFNAGDIGYVKKNLGHYIKNTGDTDLQVLEVFRAPYFADISLSDWISRTPPLMVAQHLNVSEETIAKFPRNKPEIVPV